MMTMIRAGRMECLKQKIAAAAQKCFVDRVAELVGKA